MTPMKNKLSFFPVKYGGTIYTKEGVYMFIQLTSRTDHFMDVCSRNARN